MTLAPGNLLGAPRAEADRAMLESAFLETRDFLALVQTDDFNFVVGRRGTGKSALFQKLAARVQQRGDTLLLTLAPEEHEAADLSGLLLKYGSDYVTLRRIAKLLWRAELLFRVIALRDDHYKRAKLHSDALDQCCSSLQLAWGPLEVNDEYSPKGGLESDFRTKRIGTVIGELQRIPCGHDGQDGFEKWMLQVVKLLFAGTLANAQLKPNGDAVKRRDVVATNMASNGFWKRILDDYHCRQVVFEAKNFDEIGPDEFRQLTTYLTGEYGNFGVIVTRTANEALTDVERGWVKEAYHTEKKLIMLLPASMLARAVGKVRSPKRHDYADNMLQKRMDTFVRSYISLRHQRTRRP